MTTATPTPPRPQAAAAGRSCWRARSSRSWSSRAAAGAYLRQRLRGQPAAARRRAARPRASPRPCASSATRTACRVVRGQEPRRRRARHRLPARAGALLPDGPHAPARGGASSPSSSAPRRCQRRPRGTRAAAPRRGRTRACRRCRADERALLRAYTEGVAAGLAALGAPPSEYLAAAQRARALAGGGLAARARSRCS